jgi:hypothetical protein
MMMHRFSILGFRVRTLVVRDGPIFGIFGYTCNFWSVRTTRLEKNEKDFDVEEDYDVNKATLQYEDS